LSSVAFLAVAAIAFSAVSASMLCLTIVIGFPPKFCRQVLSPSPVAPRQARGITLRHLPLRLNCAPAAKLRWRIGSWRERGRVRGPV
jgi:hypothetical protein